MDKYVNVRNIAAERERTFKSTFVRWESLLVLMFIAVNVMNICISPNYLKHELPDHTDDHRRHTDHRGHAPQHRRRAEREEVHEARLGDLTRL